MSSLFQCLGSGCRCSIGEDHDPESHIIPIVLQVALGQRDKITVYGTDYPTPDGTCVRDYIHVEDLATAHLAALLKLAPSSVLKMNLGTGVGHSVSTSHRGMSQSDWSSDSVCYWRPSPR